MIKVRLATSRANISDKMIMLAVRRLPSATRPSTLFMFIDSVTLVISWPTPVPSSPQRSSKPTAMKLESSDEPPWLMKGNVMPVSGMTRVMPPTMMKACRQMVVVRPAETRELKSLFARAAVT